MTLFRLVKFTDDWEGINAFFFTVREKQAFLMQIPVAARSKA
jgi:hypothetical protein